MICYKCGQEVGNAKRCPNCGADLSVFLKVRHISNAYYNLGLEQAGVRNLSGAIVSLKNSLKFNKYNIDARNLLGLIYCETGEVVDALSEGDQPQLSAEGQSCPVIILMRSSRTGEDWIP